MLNPPPFPPFKAHTLSFPPPNHAQQHEHTGAAVAIITALLVNLTLVPALLFVMGPGLLRTDTWLLKTWRRNTGYVLDARIEWRLWMWMCHLCHGPRPAAGGRLAAGRVAKILAMLSVWLRISQWRYSGGSTRTNG